MSTTEAQLVRTHQGRDVPAPGTYVIDTSHSSVEFVARHLGLSKVRGHFTNFSGDIQIAENPEESSVEVDVDVASVESADARRDEHLRSPDFFHVEEHPSMSFKSTSVTPVDDGTWQVGGLLTIRGVTHPVVLETEFEGGENTPFGDQRIGFSASTEINREDWDLGWNAVLESGGLLVGKKIKIDLNVEAIRQS
ncbi:MAG: YceI family protein [Acidimicrobiia bacterium]|nr:YceI family protein [Acidimicrobiia bacterium]MBV9041904.1 YceI family protein [Acidimicrobiia bacterium]